MSGSIDRCSRPSPLSIAIEAKWRVERHKDRIKTVVILTRRLNVSCLSLLIGADRRQMVEELEKNTIKDVDTMARRRMELNH